MTELHATNIAVHVVSGLLALAGGLVAMTAVKGGPLHRGAGQIFVSMTAFVLLTAIIGVTVFRGPIPLAAALFAAGYQYLSSLRSLAMRSEGPRWPDFVLAMAGLAAGAFLVLNMNDGGKSWPPEIGYGSVGFVLAVIAYDLSRYAWPGVWMRHVRPLDHGVKMTNVYFGLLSAGVGNSFRDFQPWSQVGPLALGFVVVIILVSAYLRRKPMTA